MLRLAWPNVIALSAGTCVVIAETSYIGRLGVESLAAMALLFPCVILTMTMSGGAMGGGVASSIARALGAGDIERASALASHALLIGLGFGLVFVVGMGIFGPKLLELLGGRGKVLENAVGYAHIFFGGAMLPWLMNTSAGILRGTGNMKLPSLVILNSAACQIVLGGTLGLGLGPIPQFGMRGVAAGSLTAYTISLSILWWYLFSGRARIVPKIRGLKIQRAMFFDILKVGAGLVLFAAAIGADHLDLHPHAGRLRHRDPRRLRHRRAAGIHADLDRVRGRHRLGADDRHVDRRRPHRSRTADRLDRGRDLVCDSSASSGPSSRSSRICGSICSRRIRACARPAINICRPRRRCTPSSAGVVDVFLVAGRGESAGAGAGANRAADVHRRRRLLALDA